MQSIDTGILSNGLIQQIPVACILVYAMHRFLSHLEKRDQVLGTALDSFSTNVREMTGELAQLVETVASLRAVTGSIQRQERTRFQRAGEHPGEVD